MKKFIALLFAAVLIVTIAEVTTAFAGCSISGKSEVKAGGTYTYTVKVTASGIDMFGNVKCGGVFSGNIVQFDAKGSGRANESLSATATITVTVSSGAQPGDTGRIYIDNAAYTYYDESGNPKAKDLSGSKTVTVVTQESPPSTTRKRTSAKPTPAPSGWALAAIDIPAMAAGGSYNIEVTDDTTVPAAVLAALKEKQGVLNVTMGGCTCIIIGAQLGTLPKGLKGIDLGFSMKKDEELSAAAGGADVYQLHFNYSGALPGRFAYKIKADMNRPGDTVYLYYYYDAPGVIEGRQACVVDTDGYITVDIYHCSAYFISNKLVEGAAGILTQPVPEATEAVPTEVTPEAQVSIPAAQTEVLTVSETSPAVQWFGVPYAPLIASLAAAALLSMLLTMLFTRTGLFRRKPKTVCEAPDSAKTTDDAPSVDTPPVDTPL